MENHSHLERCENSFESLEGFEKSSLEGENDRADPVDAVNPSSGEPKNDSCIDIKINADEENRELLTNSNDLGNGEPLDCEDTSEIDRSKGENGSEKNTVVGFEGGTEESDQHEEESTDSQNSILPINVDQPPTEAFLIDLPQVDASSVDITGIGSFQSLPSNEIKNSETICNPNDNDFNEDTKDICMEAIPATPEHSDLFSNTNKDPVGNDEDSISIGGESKAGSTSPSIPATPRAYSSDPSSPENLPTSPNCKDLGPLRRSSCDSRSSRTSSTERVKSESGSTVSSPSSPSRRKSKREGSSSPILLRRKRKATILSDTETEISFNSSENQTESCPAKLPKSKKEGKIASEIDSSTKSENRRPKKHGADSITTNDDPIAELISRMEEAADEDRELFKRGLPATKKVSMINYVVSQLRKKDLQPIFLEHSILSTLTEWLSPFSGGCLPCFQIRDSILRVLDDFPRLDANAIRYSGIGKILKFLLNHPKETKQNKERCRKLINDWSQDDTYQYKVMTKKEREQLDQELYSRYAPKKKEPTSSRDLSEMRKPRSLDASLRTSILQPCLRPRESGWCPRARVPQPSMKDYVKRPESKMTCEIITKKKPNRFETMMKKYQKLIRDKGTFRSGAKLSIVGNKM